MDYEQIISLKYKVEWTLTNAKAHSKFIAENFLH